MVQFSSFHGHKNVANLIFFISADQCCRPTLFVGARGSRKEWREVSCKVLWILDQVKRQRNEMIFSNCCGKDCSYHGMMIIEMQFVMTCVSATFLYLYIVIRLYIDTTIHNCT